LINGNEDHSTQSATVEIASQGAKVVVGNKLITFNALE
jgi:hypothetical protein